MFDQLKKGTPALDISDCPDLAPILFAVAAAKNGGVFSGTRRLKIKESSRAEVMTEELAKFGVSSSVYDDEVIIYPIEFKKPSGELDGQDVYKRQLFEFGKQRKAIVGEDKVFDLSLIHI